VFTQTYTPTASFTPTPKGDCGTLKVSAAYPNPVMNQDFVKVNLYTFCPKTVKMTVVTAAYRQVYQEEMNVLWNKTAVWNITDDKGARMASGLYYIIFTMDGNKTTVPVVITR
jgi:hypothetical protein